MNNKIKACIFNIQRFSIHDGPGIRTTVFFKGCPLNCTWCSNPESQNFQPEPIWDKIKEKYITTGKYETVENIMKIIMKDIEYYHESDGGVTISGGEVLSQSEFSVTLLEECKKQGIHTACETSAFSSEKIFNNFIEYPDLLIIDIKHYDSLKHREKTGVPLEPVLRNIKYALLKNKNIIFRIPVIPEYNDSMEDALNFVKLLEQYNISKVELLPFHQFGKSKYKYLNRKYEFENKKQIYAEDLRDYKKIFLDNGIECLIT
jgi:pyruvate formate lyase activating enzyme